MSLAFSKQSSVQLGDRLSRMCGGIEYQNQKIYFPRPDARLPVRLRNGNVTWVTWGRRKDEAHGKFPNGGWARLNSIKSGKWKPWHPRPVLIVADQFMEKDQEQQSHWGPLDTGVLVQGLLAERNDALRVYVVTVSTPPEYAGIDDRWPRFVPLDQCKEPRCAGHGVVLLQFTKTN